MLHWESVQAMPFYGMHLAPQIFLQIESSRDEEPLGKWLPKLVEMEYSAQVTIHKSTVLSWHYTIFTHTRGIFLFEMLTGYQGCLLIYCGDIE